MYKSIQSVCLKVFLAFLMVFSSLVQLKATHIIGGEIVYECLGNGTYEVLITIYRDCDNGIADFDDPAILGIFDEDSLQMEINLELNDRDTLTPIVADSCLIPPNICVETTTYRKEIEIPQPSGGLYFTYFECCRNNDIINIINDESTGSVFLSYMSEQSYNDCNNSLEFNDWPPLAICVNEPINWDHSLSNVNFDHRVVYRLCAPLNFPERLFNRDTSPIVPGARNEQIFDRIDTVAWEVGFSEDLMLNGSPDISIDSITGFIEGVPTQLGRYVIGICVDEYDFNNNLVSYLRRDFQYNVSDCSNTLAAYDIDSVQCYYEGEELVIAPVNTTPNTDQFLWSLYNNSSGDTLSSTETQPRFIVQDTGIYTIRLISKPFTACADTFIDETHVVITGIDANFRVAIDDCNARTSRVQFLNESTVNNSETIAAYEWYLNQEIISQSESFDTILNVDQSYELELFIISNQGCSHSIRDSLNLINPPNLEFPDVYTCEGDSTFLNPMSVGANLYLEWRTINGELLSTNSNPAIWLLKDSCFIVEYYGSGLLSCKMTDTVCVNFISEEGLPNFTCELIDIFNNSVQIDCDGENCDVYRALLNDGRFPDSNVVSYPYIHNYASNDTSYIIEFIPEEGALKCGLDTTICMGSLTSPCCNYPLLSNISECSDSIVLDIGIGGNCPIDSIQWTINSTTYTERNLELVFQFEELPIDVSYTLFSATCFDIDSSLAIDPDYFEYPDLQSPLVQCPSDDLFLNPGGDESFTYVWEPANLVSNSNAANPFSLAQSDQVFRVTITDPNTSCQVDRRVQVQFSSIDDGILTPEVLVCDTSFQLCVENELGYDYQWYTDSRRIELLGDSSCLNTTLTESQDSLYLVIVDENSCEHVLGTSLNRQDIQIVYDQIESMCSGDTISIELLDPLGRVEDWFFDNEEVISSDDGRVTLTATEDFDLNIELNNSFCSEFINITIDIFDNTHTVSASSDLDTVNKGDLVQLMSVTSSNAPVQWWPAETLIDNPQSENPRAQPTESTRYYVYSEDSQGCDAIDSLDITFSCICDEPYIYVPNAFTPNNDNLNENFNVIMAEDLLEEMELSIFNRWGEQVFNTTSLDRKWNGTFNGNLVAPDVYAYYLRIKCVGTDDEFTKKGNVTVLY